MKVLLVVNGRSSKLKNKDIDESIVYLNSKNMDYKVLVINPTERYGEFSGDDRMYSSIDELRGDAYDVVVIEGGDGTVNRIVNELIAETFKSTYIALIPLGNINILAKYLNLTRTQSHMAEIVNSYTAKKYVEIQPVKINGKYFMCVTSMGADANIVASIENERDIGFNMDIRLVYAFNIFKAFIKDVYAQNILSFDIEVSLNRGEAARDIYQCYTALVLNIPVITYFSNVPIAYRRDRSLFKGFDVLIVQEKGAFNILRDFFFNAYYYKVGEKKYLNTSFLLFKEISYISLNASLSVHYQIDGENAGMCNTWVIEEDMNFPIKVLVY